METTYFEESYASINWDDETQCLIMKWKGVVTDEKFKTTADKAVELLKSKGGSRWLADDTQLIAWSHDIQNWLAQDWHPRAVAAGLKYMAIVLPKSAMGRFTSQKLNTKVTPGTVTTQYVETYEEAKAWLRFK